MRKTPPSPAARKGIPLKSLSPQRLEAALKKSLSEAREVPFVIGKGPREGYVDDLPPRICYD